MLGLVPDQLKTKNIFKQAVKKPPLLVGSVFDWQKTKEVCDKVILENGGTLMFVHDFCKYK